jgi:membrane protein
MNNFDFNDQKRDLQRKAKDISGRIQKSPVGRMLDRFGKNQTSVFAAGLAFYAFFSVFPLLIALVAIGSMFLEQYLSREEIIRYIISYVPVVYQDFIQTNLDSVLQSRGAIGLIALVGLIWSASGYFNTLIRGINMAWPEAKPRNALGRRLAALSMVTSSGLLLIISFLGATTLDVLSQFKIPLGGSLALYQASFWNFLVDYLPFIISLAVIWLLFLITPNYKVKKRSAFIAALPTAVAWNLLNNGFSYVLRSGLINYEIVYGSLSTIVSLLFWIYLSNLILLIGAYLSAVIQHRFFPNEINPHQYISKKNPNR